jgi:hypothetical protein
LFVIIKKRGTEEREKFEAQQNRTTNSAEFYSSLKFFTQTELRENAKCVFSSHYSSRCFGRITSSFKEEELLQ